jgi:hypothetical protein
VLHPAQYQEQQLPSRCNNLGLPSCNICVINRYMKKNKKNLLTRQRDGPQVECQGLLYNFERRRIWAKVKQSHCETDSPLPVPAKSSCSSGSRSWLRGALAKDKGDVKGWCGGVIEGIGSGECRCELGEWVKNKVHGERWYKYSAMA